MRHNVGHALSVTSDKSSQSVWYSPWGWYEWYNTSSANTEMPEETGSAMTEAELIKGAALSRVETPENPPALSSDQPSDPPSPLSSDQPSDPTSSGQA